MSRRHFGFNREKREALLTRRDAQKSQSDIAAEQEAKLLKELERGQKKLAGAKEISLGTAYTESLKTSWVLLVDFFP